METFQYLPPLAVFLLGIAGFYLCIRYAPKTDNGRTNAPWRKLGQELSMALVVAAVVSLLFELYQRSHDTLEATQRAFNASMADALTPDVWDGVKRQILDKRLLRQNVTLRGRLSRSRDLPANLAIWDLQFEYELLNLDTRKKDLHVQHELDYQFRFPERRLPRFERVVMETRDVSREFDESQLKRMTEKGTIDLDVALDARGGSPVRILTRRLEVVNAPGSYNLYMTEFTKGIRIYNDGIPPGVGIEVRVRPEGEAQTLKKVGTGVWVCDSLVLPGQGIEFKFLSYESP